MNYGVNYEMHLSILFRLSIVFSIQHSVRSQAPGQLVAGVA